jgi:hypothetical protein
MTFSLLKVILVSFFLGVCDPLSMNILVIELKPAD